MAGESVLSQRGADEGERLLIEAAQRDPGRFGALYELHFERVYAFVARRVQDRATAQDLTADVFHQALAHLARFEWRGIPFAAWLFRIAANAIANHAQRTARAQRAGEPDAPSEPRDAELERVEQRARLYRLVDELPDDQRRVLVLRFAEDRSVRDIAQVLGRSEGAVKQLQFRALQTLRGRLDRSDG